MRYLIGCIFLAVISLVHAEKLPEEWHFLMAGDYHSGEAPAKPGNGWFALAPFKGRWYLLPTEVRATPIHDAALDDGEDEKTGVNISSGNGSAIALLRGLGLRVGKVDTPNMHFPVGFSRGHPLSILFKGQSYQVLVMKSKDVYLRKGKQYTKLQEITVSKDQKKCKGQDLI